MGNMRPQKLCPVRPARAAGRPEHRGFEQDGLEKTQAPLTHSLPWIAMAHENQMMGLRRLGKWGVGLAGLGALGLGANHLYQNYLNPAPRYRTGPVPINAFVPSQAGWNSDAWGPSDLNQTPDDYSAEQQYQLQYNELLNRPRPPSRPPEPASSIHIPASTSTAMATPKTSALKTPSPWYLAYTGEYPEQTKESDGPTRQRRREMDRQLRSQPLQGPPLPPLQGPVPPPPRTLESDVHNALQQGANRSSDAVRDLYQAVNNGDRVLGDAKKDYDARSRNLVKLRNQALGEAELTMGPGSAIAPSPLDVPDISDPVRYTAGSASRQLQFEEEMQMRRYARQRPEQAGVRGWALSP
jgi:hypothetical protein